jgi:hypothetical protein
MNASPYRRLPGRYRGLGYGTSLWEAEDHLLLVRWILVSESYNRFYYRDIQAISFCTTSGWIFKGILLGLGAAGLGLLAALAGGGFAWLLGVPAAVLLICAVFNFWAGPSCRTTIQTAIQTQTIASLHRKKNALAVIEHVRARIDSVQAEPLP